MLLYFDEHLLPYQLSTRLGISLDWTSQQVGLVGLFGLHGHYKRIPLNDNYCV